MLIHLLQTFKENNKYRVRLYVTFVAGINTGNFNVIGELLCAVKLSTLQVSIVSLKGFFFSFYYWLKY